MVLLFNSLAVILIPVLMSGSSCQTAQQNSSAVQVNTTTTVNQTVDNSFDDPFVRLMNASSIEEALALNILYKDNHIATAADLGASQDAGSGKLLVSGGYGFAVPDGCHPRDQTVRVDDVKGLSATSRVYPQCIKVPRCGGCCGIPNVDCVPQYKEREVYNLVEIAMSGGGMTVVGTYPVEVERHVSCQCVCGLSDEKCGPHKEFNSAACSCTCPNTVVCYPPKMYSPETCGCVCELVEECCPSGGDCGFVFNYDSCECDVARVHSSSDGGNTSQSNVDQYLQNQQAIMAGRGSSDTGSTSWMLEECVIKRGVVSTEWAGEDTNSSWQKKGLTPLSSGRWAVP
ncbi:hypothetical protein RRG08_046470 [Elysia crispata]|uniref:Platelet-derived growth factor (PDGF) family profile domain-containing protein n=1 Tax=Elysia crispata TaxID=231223 RepID=A0AAE0YIR6_9GAST|nr:hypothetical protein RRG08_046470 [Elysia crispata]